MKKQFWIIDTGGTGESMNTREASGPYSTKKAAEKAVLKDHENFWDDACTCLKEGCDKDNWCAPLLNTPTTRYRIKPEPRTFEMWLTSYGSMYPASKRNDEYLATCERITVLEVVK